MNGGQGSKTFWQFVQNVVARYIRHGGREGHRPGGQSLADRFRHHLRNGRGIATFDAAQPKARRFCYGSRWEKNNHRMYIDRGNLFG